MKLWTHAIDSHYKLQTTLYMYLLEQRRLVDHIAFLLRGFAVRDEDANVVHVITVAMTRVEYLCS